MPGQKPTLDYEWQRLPRRRWKWIVAAIIAGLLALFAGYVYWTWSSANWRGIS